MVSRTAFFLASTTLLLPGVAFAASFTSVQSGSWTDPTTWGTTNWHYPAAADGVAVDTVGNIYVTTYGASIEKFSSAGQHLATFGVGTLSYSYGISLDPSGNLYVADRGNGLVRKFNSAGTLISSWGPDGIGGSQSFHDVYSVLVENGKVFVSDVGADAIYVFDTSGAAVTSFSSASPTYMAVDSQHHIWATDLNNDSVHEYTEDGNLLSSFGSSGTGDGQLNAPSGIAIDSSDKIYVADNEDGRIQKFDPDGTFLLSFGSLGSGVGQLSNDVEQISFDPEGNLLVADYYNSRISRFDPDGNPIALHDCQIGNDCSAGVDYPGASDNAIIKNAATVSLPSSTFSLNHLYILPGATLTQSANSTLTLMGNWFNQGTYTGAASASVVLEGTNQKIMGETTFPNLSKTVSGSDTLSFGSSGGTTVTGTLTLQGGLGQLLTLAKVNAALPTFSSVIGAGTLHSTQGVTVDSAFNTYVSDGNDSVVYKFAPSGSLTSTIGSGVLNDPRAIGVDSSDNLYVADGANRLVYKFDPSGNEVAHWGTDGLGGSHAFGNLYGLMVDNDRVYAADYSTAIIYVFDTSGHVLSSFGGNILSDPGYMSADAQHHIWVPDFNNWIVYEFGDDGTLLSSFGAPDEAEGHLKGPWFTAVDAQGFIYVAEWDEGNRVQVFLPDGTYLYTIGSEGSGDGQFTPGNFMPLALDAEGSLYVGDNGANRVEKFAAATSTNWSLHSSGTNNLSYLSVSNSTAATSMSCGIGCVDAGGNTNWVFSASAPEPTPTHHSHSSPVLSPAQVAAIFAPKPVAVSTDTSACRAGDSFSTATGAKCPSTSSISLPSAPATGPLFILYLTLGSRNDQVLLLQKYLNTHGFIINTSGPGSPGQETTIFGALTRAAIKRFQKVHGIPQTGNVGPLTRAALNVGK